MLNMMEVLNGSLPVDYGLRTEFPVSASNVAWNDDPSTAAAAAEGESRGGFDFEFSPGPESKYICPICMLVLKDPMQTDCGHRFCRLCLFQWLSNSSVCPSCKSYVQQNEIFPDNYAKREILGFAVLCPNSGKGCDDVLELGAVEKHLSDVCLFVHCVCPKGCSQRILRKNLTSHVERVCPANSSSRCQFCGALVPASDEQGHLRSCGERQQMCKLCSKMVANSEMERHLKDSCRSVVVSCKFQPFGCTEQTERQHMALHMMRNLQNHLEMLADYVLETDRKVDSSVTSILRNLTLTETELDASVSNKLATSQQMKLSAKTSSKCIPDCHQKIIIRDEAIQSCCENRLKELRYLHTYSALSEIKCTAVKENDCTDKITVSLEKTMKEQAKKLDESSEYIKRLESTIQSLGVRISGGVYLWKITDFKRRFQEAKGSRNTIVYSPGFYSSYYGYKTCLRVHLNGTGSASGKHLSLFIHFMPGDYDDILRWPFQGRITLSILDQSSSDCKLRSDICENIETNSHLEAFEKPKQTRNHKGFGYMEFVSLSTLLNAGYIRCDTLYIKALVDSSIS